MGSNMSSVPLPEPVDDVRVTWRGETEFLRAEDDYYIAAQLHAHAAAVSAALLESMASERHRAFLLAERVRVLEEALQSIEHDSKYFGPSELKRQAREALKGASHE